jgi:two-component system sensor histidine kinase QseC
VRSWSLRRRLLTLLLASVAVAWSVTSLLTYQHAHHELDELLDAHLARAARMLMAQPSEELAEIHLDEVEDPGPYGQDIAVQLWRDDRLVLRTVGAPSSRLSPATSGFSDSIVDGRQWRVFSGRDREGQLLVQVAEDHALRERLLAHYTLSSLPALLVGLPLLGMLIWAIVGSAIRPVAAIGDAVSQRGPADLRPLDGGEAPTEIVPLVHRLNALFARITDSMQAERRFTSHAAHELRTPIAAIRAQAEVARDSRDGETRRNALSHVIEGCDRAARLVDQKLMLARIDERQPQTAARVARMERVAAQVIADLAPAALDRDVVLELETDEDATIEVAADPALFEVLIRNLLDNAIRHGGAPGHVTIRCTRDAGTGILQIRDRGPGVAADDIERLGQRFFRAGDAGLPGTGLGLSIVRRIVESSGGTVEYRNRRSGGLEVTARIPLAMDAAPAPPEITH